MYDGPETLCNVVRTDWKVNIITILRLSNQLTQWHVASIVYTVVLSNILWLEHRVITVSIVLLYE
jgi:hypothetical protein